MSKIFDIWVNISPILFFFTIYAAYKGFKDEEDIYWFTTFLVLLSLNISAVISAFGGFGNSVLSMITLTLWIIFFVLYIFLSDAGCFGIIIAIICILCLGGGIYLRLNHKTIIDVLEQIDVSEIFSSTIQNEWFKGIAIAAIGGIISGLVLKEKSKKK